MYGNPTTDPPAPDKTVKARLFDKIIRPGLMGFNNRSKKTEAEELSERLVEAFLFALRNAVWQYTYEKQKSWSQMTDKDLQTIFKQAFSDCGMKFLMDNNRVVKYINEISLYAFDDVRGNMDMTNTVRESQIRSHITKLKGDPDVAL